MTFHRGTGVTSPHESANASKHFAEIKNSRVEESDNYYDPFRMEADEAYQLRVRQWMQIRYYLRSPAKDTPECQTIRQLLEEEGVGLEAVADVYNAVWEYKSMSRALDKTTGNDAAAHELVRTMFKDSAIHRIRLKHGLTNEAFFSRVFDLNPSVFFGLNDQPLLPGEPLFESP